jgi:hypothetical protein
VRAEVPSPEPSDDETAVQRVIEAYHRGFEENDAGAIRASLGQSLVMFNGNYSDDSTRWQAHMYLQGKDLDSWPSMMIAEAGPFENRITVEHVHVRGDSALLVTRETGRNRFRSWDDQAVTWLFGRQDGRWGIVGMFVRDERNPEASE